MGGLGRSYWSDGLAEFGAGGVAESGVPALHPRFQGRRYCNSLRVNRERRIQQHSLDPAENE